MTDDRSNLGMDAELTEMREAVVRLNAAADAYYNGLSEQMTDFEWDALFDRVRELEQLTGIVLDDSPTNRVSADSTEGQKEEHEFSALSLAKTKQVIEVAKWSEGRPVWISWKLDGLTLVATYDHGALTKLVTRGDGHIGTNITHLASAISGVPTSIPEHGHLVVRGEAVISYADFREFVAESQEDYANPRNLASGSLTLKDVEEVKLRRLQWIPFTLVSSPSAFNSWGAGMEYLRTQGFSPVESEFVTNPTAENLTSVIERWTLKVTDGINPYPVDGLVVAYEDADYARTGSVTGHHATRAGLAFKWADESVETRLERIEWSCAVSSITPVAVFEPVQLEGTVVRRASLCNLSELARLGVGGVGTRLSVIKANKIIPKVIAVIERVGALEIPATCPVCGAATETRVSGSGTHTLRCTNARCPARELRRFMRFVSKQGLDLDGFAGETLSKFVNRGWIRNVVDILRLGSHRDEIAAMEGFGEKSADNFVEAIETARDCDAVKLLNALAIPLVGPDVARRLLGAYPLRELFAVGAAADSDEFFSSIDGIGPGKSAAFVAWCHDPANITLVNELLGELRVRDYVATKGGRCEGLVFVVTGDVHVFANRDAFKAYVVSEGGKVSGSVSSKTAFLVNNDLNSSSGKNHKAHQLGIPIISEDEFIARFKG